MGTIVLQIPQVGSPNSTEDPKIASDLGVIQTLVNGNLDTNNLKTTTAGITRAQLAPGASYPNNVIIATTNTAPAAGSFVIAENALLIALPAAVAGSLVAILAATTATVTINPPGGAQILLGGASGFVSSTFMTGVLGSCWLFISDGTNWIQASTNT